MKVRNPGAASCNPTTRAIASEPVSLRSRNMVSSREYSDIYFVGSGIKERWLFLSWLLWREGQWGHPLVVPP